MAASATPSEFVSLLRRRRMYLLIPLVVLFGISAAAALLLPSVYEGTATIRIERQQIPRTLIEVASDGAPVDEYLEVLSQRVLSDENLWDVAEKHELYADLRVQEDAAGPVSAMRSKSDLGAAMRADISRKTLYIDVGPPGQRRGDSVAVAFSITYRAGSAQTARDVANALADLYLATSDRIRGDQAARLAEFLKKESDRLGEKVASFEQRLAVFKEENAASLPGQTELNLRRLDDAREQADRSREQIQALTQQRISLTAELARLEPRLTAAAADPTSLTPQQRVERLRADYLNLSATYSPRHPDMVRVRSELQALSGAVPKAAQVLRLISVLETRRGELLEAAQNDEAGQPRVAKISSSINEIRAELSALGDTAGADQPNNPAYITIQARLQAVESELQSETALELATRQRLQAFEASLSNAPAVEQAHSALMRDYESALREYQETRDRFLLAQVTERVERAHISDRFSLLSQAALPAAPVSPNRAGIAALGLVLALGVGIALAALAEYLDQTIQGARSVLERFGSPPLATIPAIRTPAEQRRRVRRVSSLWAAGALLAAAATLVGLNAARADRSPAATAACGADSAACQHKTDRAPSTPSRLVRDQE